MTQRQEIAIDGGAVIVTVALLLVTVFGARGVIREFLALGFVAFVPGWALLDHIELARGTGKVALAVAQAKDGAHRANGRDLTLPDGRKLLMGSSGTGAAVDGRDPTEKKK